MTRKILKFLTSRVFITILLVGAQLAWLMLSFLQLAEYVAWLPPTLMVLSVLLVLFIINKGDSPAYKIAWIIFIMTLPLLGGPAYLLFGNKRPARRLRKALEAEHEKRYPQVRQDAQALKALWERSRMAAGTARYVLAENHSPLWQNTSARYFPLGDDMFPAMLEDLRAAKHFIFLEYFIINEGVMWSSILEILKEKAREGVDVRLIYDDMGNITRLPIDFPEKMAALGIQCVAFNRLMPVFSLILNNRDHRKILVVDGWIGYTGGINLADEYINRITRFGHWKDTAVRLEGEAVRNLTEIFLEMWNALHSGGKEEHFSRFLPHAHHPQPFAGEGFAQPFGDSPLDDVPLAENIYIDMIYQARKSVTICTPYLLIDNEMQTALCVAARRGVDVTLFTPGIPDKKIVYQMTRSYYPPLLRSGVRIFEYTPGFLHAKSIMVDDSMAVVGTVNLDYRSLYLHFECGALLYYMPCIADIKRDMRSLAARCRQVSEEDCRQGLVGNLVNAVLRLFAPLI